MQRSIPLIFIDPLCFSHWIYNLRTATNCTFSSFSWKCSSYEEKYIKNHCKFKSWELFFFKNNLFYSFFPFLFLLSFSPPPFFFLILLYFLFLSFFLFSFISPPFFFFSHLLSPLKFYFLLTFFFFLMYKPTSPKPYIFQLHCLLHFITMYLPGWCAALAVQRGGKI